MSTPSPLVYDPDPRRAWRQWCVASAQWQARYEHFLANRPPLPVGLLLGARRALRRVLMARHTTQQAMLGEQATRFRDAVQHYVNDPLTVALILDSLRAHAVPSA